MSFPPRPSVVFMGVPTIVPTVVNFSPVSFAPAVIHTIGPPQQFRPRQPEMRTTPAAPDPPSSGPVITVFVGNISERAPDAMVRQMLTCCGPVVSWKRVQGASGVLQAFGFCEFGSPESALRAIRVLHDWQIMEKKLVVKVDAKTKTLLDEFKTNKVKEDTGKSPKADQSPGQDPFFTEEMKRQDEQVMRNVRKIVRDNEPAMLAMEVRKGKEPEKAKDRPLPIPGARTQERLMQLTQGDSGLSDANLEDDQKEFISKEIGKFREIMLRQEEEREQDRKKRELERERRRSPSPTRRRRSPEAATGSRSPARRRGSPDTRRRSRSRSRDKENRREDDEEREKRKIDKKVREKEMAYQERLRVWETRERKKFKEYEKEKKAERAKKSEETKLARRLKEFLEDYDDERDDLKYYKGRELERRRAERLREIESDSRDRQREKEELEELKSKIFAQGYDNPDATYQKAILEMEEKYRPDILFKPEELVPKMTSVSLDERVPPPSPPVNEDSQLGPSTPSSIGARSAEMDETSQPPLSFTVSPSNVSSSPKNISVSPLTSAPSTPTDVKAGEKRLQPSTPTTSVTIQQKKKRMDVSEVFNTDDDESSTPKKKKLPRLDDESKPSKVEKVTDDKKKQAKGIIDKIPTSKEELFAYPMEWTLIDTNLIEKRVRPWINRKIVEYIGEPEPTLVEFIISKIMGGSSAQSILDDVQMVLDDEAEVFVVKMWRLLIFELQTRKGAAGK